MRMHIVICYTHTCMRAHTHTLMFTHKHTILTTKLEHVSFFLCCNIPQTEKVMLLNF